MTGDSEMLKRRQEWNDRQTEMEEVGLGDLSENESLSSSSDEEGSEVGREAVLGKVKVMVLASRGVNAR